MNEVKKKNESIAVLVVALTVIAAVSAGILACVDKITDKPRQEAELRQTTAALKSLQPQLNNSPDSEKLYVVKEGDKWKVLLDDDSVKKYGLDVVTFYPAARDGKLLSVIGKTISPKGYGGDMTVLAAMKPDGTIQNVMVTKNNETPGLGTVVIDRVRQKTIWGILKGEKEKKDTLPPNPILDHFDGLRYVPTAADVKKKDEIPADKWKVKKDGGDMLFVTGATISSRAVTYGVKKIVSVYYDSQAEVSAEFKKKLEGK